MTIGTRDDNGRGSHWNSLTANERPAETHQGIGRDLGEVSDRLMRWLALLRPNNPPGVAALSVPSASGGSSELFLVDLTGDPFDLGANLTSVVVKLQPRFPVYPIVDLSLQFRCLEVATRLTKAAAPKPYRYEPDPAFLGAPFLVMERKYGRGAPDFPSYQRDGWIVGLTPKERELLWCNGIKSIIALHAIGAADMEGMDLATPGRSALDRSLAYWRLYLEFMRPGWDFPVLEAAVAWLEKNRPPGEFEPGFVWGDASLRNMLFDGLELAGLLDFEFAHLGLREFDIAFFAFVDRVLAEGFAERPRLTGFLSTDETFDYYESITGRTIRHRDYFTVMASTYNTVATTRVFTRWCSIGQLDAALVRTNPSMKMLAKLIGAPQPQ